MNNPIKYTDDMLNSNYFSKYDKPAITTDTWIWLIDRAKEVLDSKKDIDLNHRKYLESIIDGVVPSCVRIVLPDPMTRIR